MRNEHEKISFFTWAERIDPRIVYVFVAISLSVPLIAQVRLEPAPMKTTSSFYEQVESLQREPGKLVLIAMDWGPTSLAENKPQTMLAIEHLMRKRIPFAVVSLYALAEPFLRSVPREVAERLETETGEKWEYGKDWVNWGYRPGYLLFVQGLAKADDIPAYLADDANATPLKEIPVMEGVTTIRNIQMLQEFTGLVGVFNIWVQFFQGDNFRPPFLHGCTSVTIPEAFTYYSSKQIVGLFEGVAGAAYYELLLDRKYSGRIAAELNAIGINSGLSFAQIVIIAFIILGNLGLLIEKLRSA